MRTRHLAVALIALTSLAQPAGAVTDEQRANVVEHFGKLKDLQEFSAGAVNGALQDSEFKTFFESYSKVITVVQVADKIAGSKDKEALQLLGGEAAKAAMEYMASKVPALGGAVGAVSFITWANTGLTLFKDFVFDPYLEKSQMETYTQLRRALDPEDAAAKTFGWGHMREKALKQLEKQGYNMELLWENGEKGKLSKQWEAKLQQFVVASYETRYTRKLVADAAIAAKKMMPELDKRARTALAKHKDDTGEEGTLAATVTLIQGKKVEFFINGKPAPKDRPIVLGKDNKLELRAIAVGPRRQQSRDLLAKKPAAITLDGVPTDYAFAYSAGKNASAWVAKVETYDWKIQSKFNKIAAQTKLASRPSVKDDKLVFTLAPDLANETITLDVTGRVQWEMTGTRATGAAKDAADESETGAIVIHVGLKK